MTSVVLLCLAFTWGTALSQASAVLQTPEERFAKLPGFPFQPHYFPVHSDKFGPLRMHYVDEGDPNAPVVLLLHGQGTWSYLYRNMIPQLVDAGYRVVAPDYIGFGRSDKLPTEADFSFDLHVQWLTEFIAGMDFTEVTAFMFDWGAFFGLRIAGEHPDYFDRIVLSNTKMPLGDERNLDWFYKWREQMRSLPEFPQGQMVGKGVKKPLPANVIEAYDAPYPDESYKMGPKSFTLINPIVPEDQPIAANKAAWAVLANWEKPVLTLYSDMMAKLAFPPSRFHEQIPGTRDQPHHIYPNRGFHLVDDETDDIGRRIIAFIQATPTQQLLYVARAPRDRTGFRTLNPSIEVFDINNNHALVKSIRLDAPPGTTSVMHIRGITASATSKMLYVSHYGRYKDLRPGGEMSGYVLALDLETDRVLWNRALPSSVDRGAVTPDGSKLFMPSGELATTPFFYTIDGATGAEQPDQRMPVARYTHNTVVTLDGAQVFMTAFGGFGNKNFEPFIHIADTRTGEVVQKVGPFAAHIRPITINGAATLVFANVNNLIGFQVGDVASGKVLYTASAPVAKDQKPGAKSDISHGISMTADETEVWVVDQIESGVHVFDVTGLPGSPPVWKQYIDTHDGREQDSEGRFLYGEDGIVGQPGWIMSSIDGRYLYPETGEIIDTTTKKVIGNLIGANGNYVHSRFALEVDFINDTVTRVGDQQGVGRVVR